MSLRFWIAVSLSVASATPALAGGRPAPSSYDEARALSVQNPQRREPRPVPPGAIVSSTDEAREVAGRTLPPPGRAPLRSIAARSSPGAVEAVSSSDEARSARD